MYKKYEELIKKLGITTAYVSKQTGISQTVFSNWKNRGGYLSAENLQKVAAVLGVSIEELLSEE